MKNTTELITLVQIPVIKEQLQSIAPVIDEKIQRALSMVCTEDTVKEIKKLRAELNRDFGQFEERRKYVYETIIQPYKDFCDTYNPCINDKFAKADIELKNKISEVENLLKSKKEQEIKCYFDEYAKSKNITDTALFEKAGIKITLSASITSLKNDARIYIDSVCADVSAIHGMDGADEIRLEYMSCMNITQAIQTVRERHAQLEKLISPKIQTKNMQNKTMPLSPPCVVGNEIVCKVTFSVTATEGKIRQLKQFMNDGGYKYE